MNLLNRIRKSKHLRLGFIVAGCVILLFALANLILGYIYYGKTYPGTTIQNRKIGGASQDSLKTSLGSLSLLPENLQFVYGDQAVEVSTAAMGITLNTDGTAQQAVRERSWLPIVNLINPPKVEVKIAVDEQQFNAKRDELAQTFSKQPVNASIQIKDGNFVLVKESDGYTLNTNELEQAVQKALAQNSARVDVPVTITKPEVTEASLATNAQDLSERQKVDLNYKFGNKTRKVSAAEIAALHEPSGTTLIVTDEKIRGLVTNVGREFGISVKNINEAVRDTKSAIQNKTALTFTLEEAPKKAYSYCVTVRGVDAGELSGFQNKINSVLNDARGWSLGGQVLFRQVESGCSFTVWLSAANQMSSFGAICDSQWSCAVSPNVVINYDRWRGASDSWNASGGSLEDYRAMVINHEVGHWLGYGHRNCGGAGQPAPVMQQQSISLQGCVFNPWPLASERDTLKRNLGL